MSFLRLTSSFTYRNITLYINVQLLKNFWSFSDRDGLVRPIAIFLDRAVMRDEINVEQNRPDQTARCDAKKNDLHIHLVCTSPNMRDSWQALCWENASASAKNGSNLVRRCRKSGKNARPVFERARMCAREHWAKLVGHLLTFVTFPQKDSGPGYFLQTLLIARRYWYCQCCVYRPP
jgi:hypothetical protein